MIANDILRLAGLDITISPEQPKQQEIPTVNSGIKYSLINAIDFYSAECDKARSDNVKQVYDGIIKSIDGILGMILQNNADEAKKLFNQLDDKVKCGLSKYDKQIADFFGVCEEPEEQVEQKEVEKEETEEKSEKPEESKEEKSEEEPKSKKSSNIKESQDIKILDLSDTIYDEEEPKPKKVDVPSEVIKDIKLRIKEMDDGDSREYTAHLSGFEIQNQQYTYAKKALENILDCLIDPDEESIKYATLYLSNLDTVMKGYIPLSVWKFLCVTYSPGTPLKVLMTAIKGTK